MRWRRTISGDSPFSTRWQRPLPLHLHAEMGASLLEGDLDAPTLLEPGHDPHRLAAQLSSVQSRAWGAKRFSGSAHQHSSH